MLQTARVHVRPHINFGWCHTCGTTQVAASDVETTQGTTRLAQAVGKRKPRRDLRKSINVMALAAIVDRNSYFGNEKDDGDYSG